MCREDNLIPQAHVLTVDEQSMGGKASAVARREKKLMRERLEVALELPHYTLEGDQVSKGEAVVVRLVDEAIAGNVAAAKTIIQTIDGLPRATIEVEQQIPPEVYEHVERVLAGAKE